MVDYWVCLTGFFTTLRAPTLTTEGTQMMAAAILQLSASLPRRNIKYQRVAGDNQWFFDKSELLGTGVGPLIGYSSEAIPGRVNRSWPANITS